MTHSRSNAKGRNYPHAPVLDVTVTKEQIAHAIRGDSSHCMISDAIAKQYPWAEYVSTDLQTVRITNRQKGLRYIYLTPRLCQRHLVDFDQGINPEPFTFRLAGAHVCKSAAGKPRNRLVANDKIPGANKAKTRKDAKKLAPAPRGLTSKSVPAKAILVTHRQGANKGLLPHKVGGKAPPRLAASTRREFGLRGYGSPGRK